MPLQVFCPGCNHLYVGIDQKLAGRSFSCKQCKRTVLIPTLDGSKEPQAAPGSNLTPPSGDATHFNHAETKIHAKQTAPQTAPKQPGDLPGPSLEKPGKKSGRSSYVMHPDDSGVLDIEGPGEMAKKAPPKAEQPRITADAVPALQKGPPLDPLAGTTSKRKAPAKPAGENQGSSVDHPPTAAALSNSSEPDLAAIIDMERSAAVEPVAAGPRGRIAEPGKAAQAKKTLASDLGITREERHAVKRERSGDEPMWIPMDEVIIWTVGIAALFMVGFGFAWLLPEPALYLMAYANYVLWLPNLVVGILLIVAAFRSHVLWGLASLFTCGVGNFFFVIVRWCEVPQLAKAFVILSILAACQVGVVFGAISSLGAQAAAKERAAERREKYGNASQEEIDRRKAEEAERSRQQLKEYEEQQARERARIADLAKQYPMPPHVAITSEQWGRFLDRAINGTLSPWSDVLFDSYGSVDKGVYTPGEPATDWSVVAAKPAPYLLPANHRWQIATSSSARPDFVKSAAASRLVGAVFPWTNSTSRLEIWDPYHDTPVGFVSIPAQNAIPRHFGFSSDGSAVAYFHDASIHVVSTASQQVLKEISLPLPPEDLLAVYMPSNDVVLAVQSSPSREGLLHAMTLSESDKVQIYELASPASASVLSLDGRYVYYANGSDGKVHSIEVETGRPAGALSLPRSILPDVAAVKVSSLNLSPDNQLLMATISLRREVRMLGFDLSDGSRIGGALLPLGLEDEFPPAPLSADLWLYRRHKLNAISPTTGREFECIAQDLYGSTSRYDKATLFPLPVSPRSVLGMQDSSAGVYALGREDGRIIQPTISEQSLMLPFAGKIETPIHNWQVKADPLPGDAAEHWPQTSDNWAAYIANPMNRRQGSVSPLSSPTGVAVASRPSKMIAIYGTDYYILLNLQAMRPAAMLQQGPDTRLSMGSSVISGDGIYVAQLSGSPPKLTIRRIDQASPIAQVQLPHNQATLGGIINDTQLVVFSSDSSRAYATIINLENGEINRQLVLPRGDFDISPGGNYVAAATDAHLYVRQLSGDGPTAWNRLRRLGPEFVQFSVDGSSIYVCYDDSIDVYNATTGRLARTVQVEKNSSRSFRSFDSLIELPHNTAIIDNSVCDLLTGKIVATISIDNAKVIRALNDRQLLVHFNDHFGRSGEGVAVITLPGQLINDTLEKVRNNRPYVRGVLAAELPPTNVFGPGDLALERASLLPQGTALQGKKRPLVSSTLDAATADSEQAEQETLRIHLPLIEALGEELQGIYEGAPGRGGMSATQFENAVNGVRRSALRMEHALDNVSPPVQEAYKAMVFAAREMTEKYLMVPRYDRAQRAGNRSLDPMEVLKQGDEAYISQFKPEMNYLRARYDGLNRKYGERTP